MVDTIGEMSWRVGLSTTDQCEHPVDEREPKVKARATT